MRLAIIGASPISIMSAIDLSHSHQVSLFCGGGFGGAWAPVECFEKKFSSSHLLYWNPGLFEATDELNSRYNLGLVPLAPKPIGDVRIYKRFPEYSFRKMTLCSQITSHFRPKFIKAALSPSRQTYFEFDGGTSGLVSRLRAQLGATSLREVDEVIDVELEQCGVTLRLAEGREHFDRALISSRALPAKLLSRFAVHIESGKLTQVFMRVSGLNKKTFSFVKLVSDWCFAVSDVSEPESRDESVRIFCFALHEGQTFMISQSELLLKELVKRDLVSNVATVVDVFIDDHPFVNIPEEELEKINLAGNGVLQVHGYDNLSRALIDYLKAPTYSRLEI